MKTYLNILIIITFLFCFSLSNSIHLAYAFDEFNMSLDVLIGDTCHEDAFEDVGQHNDLDAELDTDTEIEETSAESESYETEEQDSGETDVEWHDNPDAEFDTDTEIEETSVEAESYEPEEQMEYNDTPDEVVEEDPAEPQEKAVDENADTKLDEEPEKAFTDRVTLALRDFAPVYDTTGKVILYYYREDPDGTIYVANKEGDVYEERIKGKDGWYKTIKIQEPPEVPDKPVPEPPLADPAPKITGPISWLSGCDAGEKEAENIFRKGGEIHKALTKKRKTNSKRRKRDFGEFVRLTGAIEHYIQRQEDNRKLSRRVRKRRIARLIAERRSLVRKLNGIRGKIRGSIESKRKIAYDNAIATWNPGNRDAFTQGFDEQFFTVSHSYFLNYGSHPSHLIDEEVDLYDEYL